MVHRQAAAHDSGLTGLKDRCSKCHYLPLTIDGEFGKVLKIALEKRKKQKEQLSDLLLEFSKKKKCKNKSRGKGNNKVFRYSNVSGGQNNKKNCVKSNNNPASTFSNDRKPANNDKTALAPRHWARFKQDNIST